MSDTIHLADLWHRLVSCSHDERRVIDRVLAGIERGREVYGPLVLANDKRNFRREGAMELRDYLFYAAAVEVAAVDVLPTVSQSCEESAAASARAGGVILGPSDDGSAVTPTVSDSSDGLSSIEIGLAELRDNAPEKPEPVEFDVGGVE